MTTPPPDTQPAAETLDKWEVFTRRQPIRSSQKPMTASQRVARRAARLRGENRCITCGQAAVPSTRSRSGFSKFCSKHLIKARETKRAETAKAKAIREGK